MVCETWSVGEGCDWTRFLCEVYVILQVKKFKNIGLAFVYLKEKELGWRIFASSVFWSVPHCSRKWLYQFTSPRAAPLQPCSLTCLPAEGQRFFRCSLNSRARAMGEGGIEVGGAVVGREKCYLLSEIFSSSVLFIFTFSVLPVGLGYP